MNSVPPVSGPVSVNDFITLLSLGGARSSALGTALTINGNISLPILSVLGGLSSVTSSNSSLSVLQSYLGSVADYQLLNTQVQEVAQRIQADQAAIAADQAIINDSSSTKDQITAAKNDMAAKQGDLATQEATLFFLGVLAASGSTQSMVNRIGITTFPAQSLPQLIGANNLTITLPKNPAAILQEFVNQLKLTTSFSNPAQLAALTTSYLTILGNLTSTQQQIADLQQVLIKLDPASPEDASLIAQYNAQIATLVESSSQLQSELFDRAVEFILPNANLNNSSLQTPPAVQTQEDANRYLSDIRSVSLKLREDQTEISNLQVALAALDPSASDYAAVRSSYTDRVASLTSDLTVQEGKLLAYAVRVQSANLSDQNPALLEAKQELLSELERLASGSTIPSNDLRPVSV